MDRKALEDIIEVRKPEGEGTTAARKAPVRIKENVLRIHQGKEAPANAYAKES